MWYWPSCVLTDYERKFVSLYKDGKKPGVLRRMYPLQLANVAQPDQNIPAVSTVAKIQIARRSRVFAITFGGNLDAWRLTVKNSNGTLYTNPTPRTNKPPIVSSLVAGNVHSFASLGFDVASAPGGVMGFPLGSMDANEFNTKSYQGAMGPNLVTNSQISIAQSRLNFPWLIEPNWVLQPNETLIFEGLDATPTFAYKNSSDVQQTLKMKTVLNICFFTWEFPGMGR